MSDSISTHLGGSASHIKIHKVALGLMMMTWTPNPISDEQAFETIKTAIECIPSDQKLFLNSGEFYGFNFSITNLELVARFFTKYPELADRCFLSVKGGMNFAEHRPDSSSEYLRRSVENILRVLDGKKKLDLFESARVDERIPIEDAMENLKGLIAEGLFDHIGLSEVSAETVKRASKVADIAAIEIEVSPWSYEDETKKVIETATELKIPVIAYSPLGKGFLSGKLEKEDLPEGDMRRRFSRFQDEAFAHNKKIVEALSEIATRKGITTAQLSLAWVSSLSPYVVPLPGTGKAHRVKENLDAGNIVLSEEEMAEINNILERNVVKGGRYADRPGERLWG